MGRQLGRCKKCNCQATIDERDSGICIWCAVRKLENEDISWLLAERDALRAELARVKAESLRVVAGEPCRIEDIETDMFVHEGMLYVIPEGQFYGIPFGYEGQHWAAFHGDSQTVVLPLVRLERWEDE